jgi:hypothetical protein
MPDAMAVFADSEDEETGDLGAADAEDEILLARPPEAARPLSLPKTPARFLA